MFGRFVFARVRVTTTVPFSFSSRRSSSPADMLGSCRIAIHAAPPRRSAISTTPVRRFAVPGLADRHPIAGFADHRPTNGSCRCRPRHCKAIGRIRNADASTAAVRARLAGRGGGHAKPRPSATACWRRPVRHRTAHARPGDVRQAETKRARPTGRAPASIALSRAPGRRPRGVAPKRRRRAAEAAPASDRPVGKLTSTPWRRSSRRACRRPSRGRRTSRRASTSRRPFPRSLT